MAVAAVLSPKVTLETYDTFLAFLEEKLSRPVQLAQRRTYAEVNEMVRSGEIDLAFVCGGGYVVGQKDFGMELLVMPVKGGNSTYHSYLIVPADSGAKSIDDLKGGSFAFTDPLSNSGRLVPLYMLHLKGETPDSFFERYTFTYSHDNSIRAVAAKLVDGASVDSLVYDALIVQEPALLSRTKIIQVSPPYGIPPVVVHPQLNFEIKEQLRRVFLEMHQEENGRKALAELGIDRFVPMIPSVLCSMPWEPSHEAAQNLGPFLGLRDWGEREHQDPGHDIGAGNPLRPGFH
ncbi:MAG: phosphate/phosphite/phosphonate transporter, periplasmic binding protein, partial [Dehalococcoidia bacterium]|nr:phosphate/phosphite/phosphonate transporter, periplasmic binding protein [Dehalococcoidia bacterium]